MQAASSSPHISLWFAWHKGQKADSYFQNPHVFPRAVISYQSDCKASEMLRLSQKAMKAALFLASLPRSTDSELPLPLIWL